MKLSLMVSLLLGASLAAWAQQAMPRMITVEPMNGKQGDAVVVSGENLAKDAVAKLFLTDGKTDYLCEVVEQTATTIKFRSGEGRCRALDGHGPHDGQGENERIVHTVEKFRIKNTLERIFDAGFHTLIFVAVRFRNES